jgi:hypothetical protein
MSFACLCHHELQPVFVSTDLWQVRRALWRRRGTVRRRTPALLFIYLFYLSYFCRLIIIRLQQCHIRSRKSASEIRRHICTYGELQLRKSCHRYSTKNMCGTPPSHPQTHKHRIPVHLHDGLIIITSTRSRQRHHPIILFRRHILWHNVYIVIACCICLACTEHETG